ncbi:MAG: 2-oxoglutarate dehydrogenase E1 component, partial [Acidobacteria bacterium]|nr:2-oxoglutarate dehydrogenase E1 component [Acidobacteriota bacterium]
MANRTTLVAPRPSKTTKAPKSPSPSPLERLERERIFDAFRRWGYLQADLDPLGIFKPLKYPDLQIAGTIADEAREIYCGTIGADFMHLLEPERRQWIIERI